ncbi:ferritin-like domain-containing protein [Alkaliphilus oremlandii]|uniref:DUF2383 domain-containing protein n=1 Tax=Alkaliphilus oremlandii (strain OhILAs) TaxID=350688 RepID=A8MGM2_ALKOO|nr:PA2169 family four-helix-bundle protein [Alkaliphilus oremlandii]ABW19245.1 conserved hypothetical protein [Alkaliphilus oremlandii OhILAs]
MVTDTDTIKALNELLQGEYMAIESFNTFIDRVEEDHIKKSFQDIQKQHRDNIEILSSHIQNMGGKPQENLGMKGKMADMKLNMDLGMKSDAFEIIEKAINGETKGVNMAEKVLRGNLDDKSRDIAGEILKKDRDSIAQLKTLM